MGWVQVTKRGWGTKPKVMAAPVKEHAGHRGSFIHTPAGFIVNRNYRCVYGTRTEAVANCEPSSRSDRKAGTSRGGRILLVSDIHGNLEALESCLNAVPAYDLVVNLGDIVGYGASPNEVAERSRELGKYFVRGNHDKAASGLMETKDFNPDARRAALWTRERLTPENRDWLRLLPQGPIHIAGLPGVQCVHGSPLDEDDYIDRDAIEELLPLRAPITFFGHSHQQVALPVEGDRNEIYPKYKGTGREERWELPLKRAAQYLISPGSVGQPRDGDWRAAFALFDPQKYSVAFYRVPYQVKAAQKRIMAAGLPPSLAERLSEGT